MQAIGGVAVADVFKAAMGGLSTLDGRIEPVELTPRKT
jgi:hypothetical protein